MAFREAVVFSSNVLLERYIAGSDYRILIVNGALVAAAKRTPACVTGDGCHTIRELITLVNLDTRRGEGHSAVLTKIPINDKVQRCLAEQGWTFESRPGYGVVCFLCTVANLSQGGTAEDVTEQVHPSIIAHCVNAASQCDLDICGVDIICTDIGLPLEAQQGAVIELNSGPGLRMHLAPSKGQPRDPCQAIMTGLFSTEADNGRIPIVSITGVNGKTTTVNLTAHILAKDYLIGKTTTTGIFIDNKRIAEGDCAGRESAERVLAHPLVECAVLETARGGILTGVAFDKCDVGVVTNIGRGDHMGVYFNNMTIEDIIEIKAVVIRQVKPAGYIVLNANDPHIKSLLAHVKSNILFFSIRRDNPYIQNGKRKGQPIIYYDANSCSIVLEHGTIKDIYPLADIPLLEKRIEFLIENVMAAIGASSSLGTDFDGIKAQLSVYINDTETNPGRFNLLRYKNTDIILDYAHNEDSIFSICKYMRTIFSKKVVMFGPAGDREDRVIEAIITELKNTFDVVILFLNKELLN